MTSPEETPQPFPDFDFEAYGSTERKAACSDPKCKREDTHPEHPRRHKKPRRKAQEPAQEPQRKPAQGDPVARSIVAKLYGADEGPTFETEESFEVWEIDATTEEPLRVAGGVRGVPEHYARQIAAQFSEEETRSRKYAQELRMRYAPMRYAVVKVTSTRVEVK